MQECAKIDTYYSSYAAYNLQPYIHEYLLKPAAGDTTFHQLHFATCIITISSYVSFTYLPS